jgi:hypothetical protein
MIPLFQNTTLRHAAGYLAKVTALALFAISLLYLYSYVSRSFEVKVPVPLYYATGCLVLLLAAAWQYWQAKIPFNLLAVFTFWFRLYLVYVMAFYITPKFFSLQFVVPEEVLEQKAGELTGFWKAWLFYGHSYTYTALIAAAEAAAALLLLFNRTYTAGALLYAFMLGIILPMNYLYGVVTMQVPVATYLLTAAFIIATDGRRVAGFVFGSSFGSIATQPRQLRWLALLYLPLLFLIVRDVVFFYKAATALQAGG